MNKLLIFFFFISIKISAFYQLEQSFSSKNTDLDDCLRKDINKCSEFKFTAKGFQCCKNIVNQESKCFAMISPIKLATDDIATGNGQILIKEYFGYNMLNSGAPQTLSSDFECPDGKLNVKYDINDFSDVEKEKLKSQKHCLKYYSGYSGAITKDICYKADLATTENSGVSCGYYEFDIIFEDNSKVKHQTCFLFNDDIITTKNLGYPIKYIAESEAVKIAVKEGKELSSYQMTGTNSKEKNFVYYSLSDTVNTNDSTMPNISFINNIYILLLILFYILNY